MDLFNKKKLSELNELFKKAQKTNDDLLESNSELINICEKLFKENKALREDYQTENQYYKKKIRDRIKELKEEDSEIYDTDSEDLVIAKYETRAMIDILQELIDTKED